MENNKKYLSIIINNRTIEDLIKEKGGFREKKILENIDKIKEVQKDNNYHILKLIDKNGDYFKINLKNLERFIVG